jgi:hypothetical protein
MCGCPEIDVGVTSPLSMTAQITLGVFSSQRQREAVPRQQQDQYGQQRNPPRGLPAFLHRNGGLNTVQKKANQMRFMENVELERQ